MVGGSFLAVRFAIAAGRMPILDDFSRSDSGQYLSIARRGYWSRTVHCHSYVHQVSHLCGNIGWFPGYPALIRAVGTVTTGSFLVAALVVSWLGWLQLLRMIWVLSDGQGNLSRWLCLLVAAFFPGQVFFGTMFPMSLALGTSLLCIDAAVRQNRRGLATFAGFVAGTSYLAMTVTAPALLLALLLPEGRRHRGSVVLAAGSVLAGLGAVLLYAQLSLRRWDAYFVSAQQQYGVGFNSPYTLIVRHMSPLWKPGASAVRLTTVQQSVLLILLLIVSLSLTAHAWARERRLPAIDLVLTSAACGMWLLPYLAGGGLSVWRSEACTIVLVPLLRRAPRWLLVLLLVGCVVVAWKMGGWFYLRRLP
ncbi:MAG: hypothetical protein QOF39_1760 [Frankiales bacterium]|nr:hypothetical protein [Frankiales bacterium]